MAKFLHSKKSRSRQRYCRMDSWVTAIICYIPPQCPCNRRRNVKYEDVEETTLFCVSSERCIGKRNEQRLFDNFNKSFEKVNDP